MGVRHRNKNHKTGGKKVDNLPAVAGEWAAPVVNPTDFVMPKILAMQGMSEMVIDRKAQIGEFRESVGGKLVGSIDKSFEVIPFWGVSQWIVSTPVVGKDGKKKKKFSRIEPMTPLNARRPFEDADGTMWDKSIDLYVLLADQVKSGLSIPHVITFKITSFKTGQLAMTQFAMNAQAGQPPFAYRFVVGGKMLKGDNGSYVVWDLKVGDKVNKEEYAAALEWNKLVQSAAPKIDNSDLEGA